jgi:hypothetical protein
MFGSTAPILRSKSILMTADPCEKRFPETIPDKISHGYYFKIINFLRHYHFIYLNNNCAKL